MAITRWRDELDGTWHESGDLDGYDYEQEAKRMENEMTNETKTPSGTDKEMTDEEYHTSIVAVAEAINQARMRANANQVTAPQSGVYGEIE